ncbi:MAG: hypothetical protein NC098_08435 [Lachnoclostridium sp.]|nr:hypothetical protein [Lachnoclostridium sp.]
MSKFATSGQHRGLTTLVALFLIISAAIVTMSKCGSENIDPVDVKVDSAGFVSTRMTEPNDSAKRKSTKKSGKKKAVPMPRSPLDEPVQ